MNMYPDARKVDLQIAYWRLGRKGRRFETLEEAFELRWWANQEDVEILGFNKAGKVVVIAPGRKVEGEDSRGREFSRWWPAVCPACGNEVMVSHRWRDWACVDANCAHGHGHR